MKTKTFNRNSSLEKIMKMFTSASITRSVAFFVERCWTINSSVMLRAFSLVFSRFRGTTSTSIFLRLAAGPLLESSARSDRLGYFAISSGLGSA